MRDSTDRPAASAPRARLSGLFSRPPNVTIAQHVHFDPTGARRIRAARSAARRRRAHARRPTGGADAGVAADGEGRLTHGLVRWSVW
jgi:hypothetical protein